MSSLSILLIGITGYIGGAVANAIKKKYPDYEYIVFVRSAQHVDAIKKLGFKPLIGTGEASEDRKIISKTASEVDVVINTADADDLELVETILHALRKSSKKLPVYIHTSGTGVVTDSPPPGKRTEYGKRVWDDLKPEDIKAIDKSEPHREVDLTIFHAGMTKDFVGYIIAPSTIYGTAIDNVGKSISDQIPGLVRTALKHRQAVYGGEGTNEWNNVHIYDLTDLYVLVLEKALEKRSATKISSDPFERFYFGSVGMHVWGDVARQIGKILHEKGDGVVDRPEAKSVDIKEVSPSVATNSKTVSNRGFADGWKPVQPSLEDSLEGDVLAVLAQEKK